jgi:hypothetical protein
VLRLARDDECTTVRGKLFVRVSLAGIEPVRFRVKSDLRNHLESNRTTARQRIRSTKSSPNSGVHLESITEASLWCSGRRAREREATVHAACTQCSNLAAC